MLVDKPLFCPAGEPQRPYLQASGINHGPCHSSYGNTVEDRIAGSIAIFVCIYMDTHVGKVKRKSRVKFRCHFWRAWFLCLPGAQEGYPDCPMGIMDLLDSVSLGKSTYFIHVGLTFLCGLCILNSGSQTTTLCWLVLCGL